MNKKKVITMLVSILYNSTMYLLVQRRVTQIGENNGSYFKIKC